MVLYPSVVLCATFVDLCATGLLYGGDVSIEVGTECNAVYIEQSLGALLLDSLLPTCNDTTT